MRVFLVLLALAAFATANAQADQCVNDRIPDQRLFVDSEQTASESSPQGAGQEKAEEDDEEEDEEPDCE